MTGSLLSLIQGYQRKNKRVYFISLYFILITFILFVVGGLFLINYGLTFNKIITQFSSNPYIITGIILDFFAVLILTIFLFKGQYLIKGYNDDNYFKFLRGLQLLNDSNPKSHDFIYSMLLNKFLDINIQPSDYFKLINENRPNSRILTKQKNPEPNFLLKELLDNEEKTTLRIFLAKGMHLEDWQKMLRGINLIYQGYYFLFYPSEIPFRFNNEIKKTEFIQFLQRKNNRVYNDYHVSFYRSIYGDRGLDLIPRNDSLFISKLSVSSPGFWEIIGKMMPLTQLREYLKERHERQKDRKYKNELEEEKLRLENLKERKLLLMEFNDREYEYFKKKKFDAVELELNKNIVIKERIEILKELGFSDEEIRTYIVSPLSEGMSIIDFFKEKGILDQNKNSDEE